MATGMFTKARSLYDCGYVGKLLEETAEHGYTFYQIEEGSLGYGHMILEAPEGYWNFEIREVYLNEWSSAHEIRRSRKLSKRQWTEIENAI